MNTLTGESLYQMYQKEFDALNIGIDNFEDLESEEQMVWDRLAERLNPRP